MEAIFVENLTKVFNPNSRKSVTALKGFNLKVEKGTIYGLLGPNGAGKTTLVKILLGITFPTAGSAKILGEDLENYKIKQKVGYLPENHKYPPYLTGKEVLRFYAQLSGYDKPDLPQRIDILLEKVRMTKWGNTKVKSYSKGMMQRLGLAQAMINDPELIFLDEPTDGVDPIGRKEIRDILKDLKSEGKTIFINSHLLSEVEMITDSVAILNKGLLVEEGTIDELTSSKEEYEIEFENFEEANGIFENLNYKKLSDSKYHFRLESIVALNKLLDELRSKDVLIKSIQPKKDTLENKFISLIKESDSNE